MVKRKGIASGNNGKVVIRGGNRAGGGALQPGEQRADVVLPGQAVTARPKRNDPCPCGSGKKHKRCCLKL